MLPQRGQAARDELRLFFAGLFCEPFTRGLVQGDFQVFDIEATGGTLAVGPDALWTAALSWNLLAPFCASSAAFSVDCDRLGTVCNFSVTLDVLESQQLTTLFARNELFELVKQTGGWHIL